jgi:16S rRNA (cytosine967-C5)-methyltransferase
VTARPSARPSARAVALDVVRRVTEQGAYSNLTLSGALLRSDLSARDRALASELAYGTIRRRGSIDWLVAPLLDRPLADARPSGLALLRLGAYQIVFTRIPPHAAVSETVALAHPKERGFVNAVLRRVASGVPQWPQGQTDADISVRTGLSEWAVGELRRYAGDAVEDAAEALAQRAPVTLRTNTCRSNVEDLESALAQARVRTIRGDLHPSSLLVESGAPVDLPGFREGWFAVQDQASSFVVDALDPQPGDRVLDVCAGPGGKAAHIACLVGVEGRVVAGDAAVQRARLVSGTADRLGVRVLVLAQDGRRPAVREGFDRVLVDAPCSGIGSARRRPELLWRADKRDLSSLARLQVGIATAAAGLLRPGGRLVYSVCTFPRAETDAVCDALLRRVPALEPVALVGPDSPAERIRLWPHIHGTDAMFLAGFQLRDLTAA